MVKAVEFLPTIRYWEGPAFQLIISCLVGVFLFILNKVLIGSIALLIIALCLLLFLILYKRSSYQTSLQRIFYLTLLAIPFAWFAEFQTAPTRALTHGITLQDTELRIFSPSAGSLESELTFEGKVQGCDGYWYDVLLKLPNDSLIPPKYHYGAIAKATLDLSSILAIKDEGYQKYLLSEGYEAIGNIHSLSSLESMANPPIKSRLKSFRGKLIAHFEDTSSKELTLEQKGLIYALCLGDRSHLPRVVKESFTSSGVAHILAVSGFHLGVIFAFLSSILNHILPRYRHRYWKYSLLMIGLFTYTLMSGASTATVRALIMSMIILVARMLNRPTDPIQLLSLTLLIFLISNPYSIWSIGLMLSISAVWGIYVFLPIFREYFRTQIKALQYVFNIILVSISAQLGVLPFLFLYFGSASFSFIWSNIPLVILSALLIPLALIALLLNLITGSLPHFAIKILSWLSNGMIEVTHFFAQSQGNIQYRFDFPLLILYFLFLIILHSWLYRKANQHYINRLS